MIEKIEKTEAKRATLGLAALIAVLAGLSMFVSEFGRRSTAQLTATGASGTAGGQTLLSEIWNMPANIYEFGGARGMARKVVEAAKWSDEEWRTAINAVNELRQENGKSKARSDRNWNGVWRPPEEIGGNAKAYID